MVGISHLADLHSQQLKAKRLAQGKVVVPGLPSVSLLNPKGSTTTVLGLAIALRPVADVAHQPSLKVLRRPDGSAESVLRRNSKYAEHLHQDDLTEVMRVLDRIVNRARVSSYGPLSLGALRSMGHPYGRNANGLMRGHLGSRIGKLQGVKGSVPSLSVINRQSGRLASSWHGEIALVQGGIEMRLVNNSIKSAYVALGTIKMQAHGPWTSAFNANLSDLDSAWRHAVTKAKNRHLTEMAMMAAVAKAVT